MTTDNLPKPRYSWSQAMSAALSLSLRAVDEVRALSRLVSSQVPQRGPEGPPGKLPKAAAWVDGEITYEGKVVTHDGGTYQALRDTAKVPTTGGEWICLARPGADGTDGRDGRGFEVKSTYDPKEKYKYLDVVTLNSTWFVARKDDPGPCPGPDWKSGPVGKRGDRGERGPAGPKGVDGPPGREVVAWQTDFKNYQATPILSDGTICAPLDLRGFFDQYNSERQ